MLVRGVNDGPKAIEALAGFVARLRPAAAYLSIPTRPPAEDWVQAPTEPSINRAYQLFREQIERVECLIDYEGNAFASTGGVEEDLLAITSVHPMREEAISAFLARFGADWSIVRKLISQERLVEIDHEGHTFFMRRLPGCRGHGRAS